MTRIPADRMDDAMKQALDSMIFKELLAGYLKKAGVAARPADLDEIKNQLQDAAKEAGMTVAQFMEAQGLTNEMINDIASMCRLTSVEISDDKAKELIKQHPEYFNGTTLKAVHILSRRRWRPPGSNSPPAPSLRPSSRSSTTVSSRSRTPSRSIRTAPTSRPTRDRCWPRTSTRTSRSKRWIRPSRRRPLPPSRCHEPDSPDRVRLARAEGDRPHGWQGRHLRGPDHLPDYRAGGRRPARTEPQGHVRRQEDS